MILLIFWVILVVVVDFCDSFCNKPRIRRSWAELSQKEKDTYLRAMKIAYEEGRFDKMSEVHWASVNFRFAHFTSGFFPWHRWFIYKMEDYLRTLGPEYECMTLTYWDWEYHNGDPYDAPHVLSSRYFGSVTNIPGCVTDGFFKDWTPGSDCVRRTWNRNFTIVGQKELADDIIRLPFYGIDSHGFRSRFEAAPHSNVHNWLGGNMGTSFSTYDPIFYLHHTNVDRLYSMWQDCHDYDKIPQHELGFDQYAGNLPNYNGIDDIMPFAHPYFPELITPRIIHHITGNTMIQMEYFYSKNRYPEVINQNNRDSPCRWDWIKTAKPMVLATARRTDADKERDDQILESEKHPQSECQRIYSVEDTPEEVASESESNGKLHSASTITLGYHDVYKSEQLIGLRFSVSLPSNAKILKSELKFTSQEATNSLLFMKISIEDGTSSDSFSSKSISERNFSKKILWNIDSPWTQNSEIQTPNLTPLLQDIIFSDDPTSITLKISGVQSNAPLKRRVNGDDMVKLRIEYCQIH